ncbi:MAG: chromosome segregation protein SMC [Candidatus Omnitrophica bacterium]|nr:chromosome segregation protein SMC [Candidatus Omnitrophota bacterium]
MYFKALELIGFKSFADKTALNFEPGVTAIVGPNGCGKSNIADGVRWVLGEQSAKSLRASSMEDVIFNGTASKDPINFAEVSLILSNDKRILPIDYDEVIITRRVFRSGETEYLLNKTPVRLKDISELLMGTGIGTESYSIIEQGKIDLILSSRPEDRRYVFEEASGITKYKSKKKEALRKLEQTEANLLRINDIIQEVKRQISSIERQARKAERYKIEFDKLKDMEVKLSYLEYKNIKTQEATVLVENEDQRQREKDLDVEIKSISLKIAGYRKSLDEVSQKVSELKTNLAETTNSFDMNLHKIEIDKERIEEAHASQKGLKSEIESIDAKLSNAGRTVESLKLSLEKVAQERTAKQRLIEERAFLLDSLTKEMGEIEEKVKVCRVQTVDYLAKETHIKNGLIKLGADIQNRKARQRRLNIEKDTVKSEVEEADRVLESVIKEFKDVEDKSSIVKSDLETKRAQSEAIARETKSMEEGLAKGQNAFSAIKSKIEFLEDLIKRHEGFKSAVKNLLVKMEEDKSSFGGIFGVLADVIKVEKSYEEAVSTFLGDDAQVIIVEKESDIINAIEYLKENRLGKASFVSLETLHRLNKPSPNVAAKYIPLKRFIKVRPDFEAVVNHFFANAYVVDSLEDALGDLAPAGGTAVVTKSGLMYNNGKISGGSTSDRDDSLLIGRKERLEDLRSELKSLEGAIRHLQEAHSSKIDIDERLKCEIKSLEGNLHTGQIYLANVKMKRDAEEANVKKLKEELEVVGLELEEIDSAIADMTKKGEGLNLELNDIEKEMSSMQVFVDNSQNLILEKRTRKEKTALEVTALRVEYQSLEKEVESLRNNLEKEEVLHSELRGSIDSKTILLKESGERARLLEDEVSNLKSRNVAISDELKVLNAELARIEKVKSDQVDKLSIDELQSKEKEKEIEALRDQIRDLDVKLTELNYKKTNLKDRINQSYRIDLETIHIELEDDMDWDALKSQVLELKDRLERIGPVNLVAIDEHKELEERHAFLIHQQEDLINAKESLHKAIQKINKTTKELFLDTFQKIQIEFKNFFRLLFGGGQAELVLIDDADVLESGIEIIVRPPGKKLQNIMLLSGGEKALTAIALLFAIFKVKPSPFCILDEIDAPLDEANVNRFSNVLKDFLKISQFIIITHNKRTIELADVMYGITMQERGVSKVVSVKFLDDKKSSEEKMEVLV